MNDYILVIGSAMVDIYGKSTTFNQKGCTSGSVQIFHGGVARNIAENLARINVNTKLITVFGDDYYSLQMKEHLKRVNCDISKSITINNHPSASLMAFLDKDNNITNAIADTRIMNYLTTDKIRDCKDLINEAKYVVFESNDYNLYEFIIKNYSKKCKFIIDTVSVTKAKNIKHLISYFHTIKCNLEEAEEIVGSKLQTIGDYRYAGKKLIEKGVSNVFITLDKNGVYYNDGKIDGILYAETNKVLNSIGAGDAFLAGVIKGYLENKSIEEVVKLATSMSIINIEENKVVSTSLNKEYLNEINEKLIYKTLIIGKGESNV